jgi:polysaccharide deacetylase 2 family uncharacterized protein YibQ
MMAAPRGLLGWLVVAAGLSALAPAPPAAPLWTEEEAAVLQRQLGREVEATKRWQATRGDQVIPWEEAEGRLALVIDDVGRELHLFEQLLALRSRLTFAVLPGAIYGAGAQLRLRADRRRYREILLHLPMEPRDAEAMTAEVAAGERFLSVKDPHEELRAWTEAALDRVPAAVGVNNHMGSALTAEREAMAAVMPALRGRGLFFLDSLTTNVSVAGAAAAAAGVPWLERSVFLDNEPTPEAIREQLRRAAERSRLAPTVAIGHPSQALVDVLKEELPRLHASGVGIFPVSELVRRAGSPLGDARNPH